MAKGMNMLADAILSQLDQPTKDLLFAVPSNVAAVAQRLENLDRGMIQVLERLAGIEEKQNRILASISLAYTPDHGEDLLVIDKDANPVIDAFENHSVQPV